MGLPDPRMQGSGNPGATNVLRLGGKKAGIITLLGDVLKGVIPMLVAVLLTDNVTILAIVMLGAFLGHLFPVFFKFKGGKGIATAGGVILTLAPVVGVLILAIWLIVAFTTRYSSLASLLATFATPFLFAWNTGVSAYIVVAIIVAILIFWRHRPNIQRLIAGTENKINLPEPKPLP